ncbi:hypothetical protein BKA59DRAFT_530607 [Fusarium tricinctum]|uniref:DUF2278 domain-containing protein n=1 Tax=Fusarium tricinctum TaxID=61284 RepID=A0A8K0RV81_9HYPO|nr:hypothetical protein BKA59DRAFT_530607 [Fusarium tricinctum]
MVVEKYGVWRAKPVRYTFEDGSRDNKSPHLELHFDDNQGRNGRAAVNIKSGDKQESRLAYWTIPDFAHGVTDKLAKLKDGFHLLAGTSEQKPDGLALDFIRSDLFNHASGRILPHDAAGPNNDIIDQLRPIVDRAISAKSTVYIYGSQFSSGKGVHNIHMNQGNPGRWADDNGIFQDGALIFDFGDHWEAVFIAFASQSAQTQNGPKYAGYPFTWVTVLAPEGSDEDRE